MEGNIASISTDEQFTRKPFNTEAEWLELRSKGIGGSDASALVGKNPYKSNVELYLEKVGLKAPEDISSKERVMYGKSAETHLRALFALNYPEFEVIHKDELLVSKDFEYIRASLDGELIEKATNRKGFLEIKTTKILSSSQRENWKEAIPPNYYCQLLHYFFVTGYDFCILHVEMEYNYNDTGKFFTRKSYYFEREQILEDMKYLISKEVQFWEENILPKKIPSLILNY